MKYFAEIILNIIILLSLSNCAHDQSRIIKNTSEIKTLNDQLSCHGTLIEEKKEGPWICYFIKNPKQMAFRLNFVHGLKEGVSEGWRENGVPLFYSEWKAGWMHGMNIYYHPNGRIQFRSQYQHGELHGQMMEWNPEGRIVFMCRYKNNQRDGECLEWDTNR